MEKAYFAGGCFWCITPTFRQMDGVSDVISGYSGGDEADPSYEDVKHQRTGHRETICICYDGLTLLAHCCMNFPLWLKCKTFGRGVILLLLQEM